MLYPLQKISTDFFEKLHEFPNLEDILSSGLHHDPEDTALIDGDQEISFARLNGSANQISRFLLTLGVVRGDRVLVSALKSWQLVAVAVGIWRVGAVYVPIDQDWPKGRFEKMVQSIEPSAAILSSAHDVFLNDHTAFPKFLLSDQPWEKFLDGPFESVACDGVDAAYIMHTSGSTGEPKGVVMSRRAVVAYFHGHNQFFRFKNGDVCLNNAPFHFDVSIQDVFLPLFFGATVCLTSGVPFPDYLLELMEMHGVTHLIIVASLLMTITEDPSAISERDLAALRVVMTGAEICKPSVLEFWSQFNDGLTVLNGYGPTEVNSISVLYAITPKSQGRQTTFPIGMPLPTVLARLVDDQDRTISGEHIPGELLLGGPQLMEGYWRKPDQTKKAFIVIDGERYYRSGDVCCLDEDENYVFVGRKDKEVKINGRRINTAEIESVLMAVKGVRYAFCDVFEHLDSKAISCIVCIEKNTSIPSIASKIFDAIEGNLPFYMLPSHFGYCLEVTFGSTGKTSPKEMFRALHHAIEVKPAAAYQMVSGTFHRLVDRETEGV